VDCLKQLLGDARPLQHRAHENEQRHRRQHEIGGHGVDLLHELEDDGRVERHQPEEKGDAHHRKGDGKAEEQRTQQRGEHQ